MKTYSMIFLFQKQEKFTLFIKKIFYRNLKIILAVIINNINLI
jgi:hypothetical protein